MVGRGNVHGRFMFVTDHPGEPEDRFGRPILGRDGFILDKFLEEARLDRGKVYLTHLIKCYSREYSKEHLENCKGWLFEEIKLLRPLVIFLFGSKCGKLLCGHKGLYSRIERRPQVKFFEDFNVTLVPLISLDRIGKCGKVKEYANIVKTYTRGL